MEYHIIEGTGKDEKVVYATCYANQAEEKLRLLNDQHTSHRYFRIERVWMG